MAGRGERVAGTPSTIYDLSSMLFHIPEAGTSYDQYIRDAKEVGDQELVEVLLLKDADNPE